MQKDSASPPVPDSLSRKIRDNDTLPNAAVKLRHRLHCPIYTRAYCTSVLKTAYLTVLQDYSGDFNLLSRRAILGPMSVNLNSNIFKRRRANSLHTV